MHVFEFTQLVWKNVSWREGFVEISHHPRGSLYALTWTHEKKKKKFPQNWTWEVFQLTAAEKERERETERERERERKKAAVACCLEASMLFFHGQSVFFSHSVISGVGRGASSRPHHWHSCPCSTHNTEPLVAWQSTHISTTFISHSAPYFCLVSPLAPN